MEQLKRKMYEDILDLSNYVNANIDKAQNETDKSKLKANINDRIRSFMFSKHLFKIILRE